MTAGCGASTEQRHSTTANQSQTVAIDPAPATMPITSEPTNDEVSAVRANPQSLSTKRHCKYAQRQEPGVGALAWISECEIKTAKPILFEFNSPVIHVESEPVLQAVANFLHDDPSLHIEIGAHSDSRGSQQFNEVLTQQRADAVKAHFVARGISPERLVARGFGETRPISHPPEVEGRRTNRRIEFVILPE